MKCEDERQAKGGSWMDDGDMTREQGLPVNGHVDLFMMARPCALRGRVSRVGRWIRERGGGCACMSLFAGGGMLFGKEDGKEHNWASGGGSRKNRIQREGVSWDG